MTEEVKQVEETNKTIDRTPVVENLSEIANNIVVENITTTESVPE